MSFASDAWLKWFSLLYGACLFAFIVGISGIIYIKDKPESCYSFIKRILIQKRIYGALFVYVYDNATDIGVTVYFGQLAYDEKYNNVNYKSLNMQFMFLCSLFILLLIRAIWITDALGHIYYKILCRLCCPDPVTIWHYILRLFAAIFDAYVLLAAIPSMINKDSQVSDLQKQLQWVVAVFESMPQLLLQTVFMLRSLNDPILSKDVDAFYFVLLSISSSILNISQKYCTSTDEPQVVTAAKVSFLSLKRFKGTRNKEIQWIPKQEQHYTKYRMKKPDDNNKNNKNSKNKKKKNNNNTIPSLGSPKPQKKSIMIEYLCFMSKWYIIRVIWRISIVYLHFSLLALIWVINGAFVLLTYFICIVITNFICVIIRVCFKKRLNSNTIDEYYKNHSNDSAAYRDGINVNFCFYACYSGAGLCIESAHWIYKCIQYTICCIWYKPCGQFWTSISNKKYVKKFQNVLGVVIEIGMWTMYEFMLKITLLSSMIETQIISMSYHRQLYEKESTLTKHVSDNSTQLDSQKISSSLSSIATRTKKGKGIGFGFAMFYLTLSIYFSYIFGIILITLGLIIDCNDLDSFICDGASINNDLVYIPATVSCYIGIVLAFVLHVLMIVDNIVTRDSNFNLTLASTSNGSGSGNRNGNIKNQQGEFAFEDCWQRFDIYQEDGCSACWARNIYKTKENQQIEAYLRQDKIIKQRTTNVLLFGLNGSGQSTLVKQLKNMYQNAYDSPEDRRQFRNQLYHQILQNMRKMILTSDKWHKSKHNNNGSSRNMVDIPYDAQMEMKQDENAFELKQDIIGDDIEIIFDGNADFIDDEISLQLKEALTKLWKYKAIQNVYKLRNVAFISDSMGYFMSSLDSICENDYIPSKQVM